MSALFGKGKGQMNVSVTGRPSVPKLQIAAQESSISSGACSPIILHNNGLATVRIECDGDAVFGSNVGDSVGNQPDTTGLVILSNAQTYNGESMGAGDLMIGNNSASKANAFYDASAGTFNLRVATTNMITLATSGTITLGDTATEHILISSTAVQIKDGATVYTDISGGVVTVGEVGAGLGNVRIASDGVQVRTNTTVKIDLQSDGDLFIGTDTSAAATTSMVVFSTAQTYNGEAGFGVGDILIGANTASSFNIKWTVSDGSLRFRSGTTELGSYQDDSLIFNVQNALGTTMIQGRNQSTTVDAAPHYGIQALSDGVRVDATGVNVGLRAVGSNNTGAGGNRCIQIDSLGDSAAHYAIYSSALAQSVHAGSLRIGSTTNPTVALDVTGAALISTTLGVTTSVTSPVVIGGSGTTSTLTLRSTSGVGTTGADIIYQVGNNGATEAMRILNSGNVGIGNTDIGWTPAGLIHLSLGSTTSTTVGGLGLVSQRTTSGALGQISFVNDTNSNGTGDTSTSKRVALIEGNFVAGTAGQGGGQLLFYTKPDGGGIAERVRMDEAGNVGIGTGTFGTSATQTLALDNGTEPTSSPADLIQIYSVDLSAGNATLGLRTETAVASDIALASTHSLQVRINGVTYKILLVAV